MRDRAGFEQGRRRDSQGRPLKLQIGGGTSRAYAANYEATFGKSVIDPAALDNYKQTYLDWRRCEDCGALVETRERRDRDAALVCPNCKEK